MRPISTMSGRVTATALAVAVVFGGATVAIAGHNKDHICASPCARLTSKGKMMHTHTRTKGVFTSVDGSASLKEQADYARAEWARDTILSLPYRSHANSSIHQLDRNYGKTGWSAVATRAADPDTGHYSHGHVKYNLHYLRNSAYSSTKNLSTPYGRRALACQEIGHLIGLAHAHGDCMGYTYVRDFTKRVSSATATFTNQKYRNTGH
jgi:hypothetical protein